MGLNGFLFPLTKFRFKVHISTVQRLVNLKFGRRKFSWIHNFDSLHIDTICSAMQSMISWWIDIFLLLFLGQKIGWGLSPFPCLLLFAFQLGTGTVPILRKNCKAFLPYFHLLITPSQIKIFIYSSYPFLLKPASLST